MRQDNSSFEWHPGERVMTRAGTVAIVIGKDSCGNVIGIGPCDRVPTVIRPCGDAWGGEHDCSLRNAA